MALCYGLIGNMMMMMMQLLMLCQATAAAAAHAAASVLLLLVVVALLANPTRAAGTVLSIYNHLLLYSNLHIVCVTVSSAVNQKLKEFFCCSTHSCPSVQQEGCKQNNNTLAAVLAETNTWVAQQLTWHETVKMTWLSNART
jgi:hypothetical protein